MAFVTIPGVPSIFLFEFPNQLAVSVNDPRVHSMPAQLGKSLTSNKRLDLSNPSSHSPVTFRRLSVQCPTYLVGTNDFPKQVKDASHASHSICFHEGPIACANAPKQLI
jgi:hypothetical protein